MNKTSLIVLSIIVILLIGGVAFLYSPEGKVFSNKVGITRLPFQTEEQGVTSLPSDTDDTPADKPEPETDTQTPPGMPAPSEKLTTSMSNGHTVTLNGPAGLMSRIQACIYSHGFFGASGNGLLVDWGDGNTDPVLTEANIARSCSDETTTHTYKTPGTYTIHVTLSHPGPADGPVLDWEGSAVVTTTRPGFY